MIGDNVCDIECNNAACEWDKLDCGCAPGCDFSDIITCKNECMVANCDYGDLPGYPACPSEIKRVAGKYYQIMRIMDFLELTSHSFNFNGDCLSGDPSCTEEQWVQSFTQCLPYGQCYVPGCLMNFGNCDSMDNCEAAYTLYSYTHWWGSLLCIECTPPFVNEFGQCVSSCSEGLVQHPIVTEVCVLEPDLTSEDNPQLIFVSPEYTEADADGSLARPYATLAEGLQHTFKQYTKLLLISQTHSLSATYQSALLASNSNAQYTNYFSNRQVVVWIDSYDCYRAPSEMCERAILQIDADFPASLYAPAYYQTECQEPSHSGFLRISNINFLGVAPISYDSYLISVGYSSLSLRNVSFFNITGIRGIIYFRMDSSIVLDNVELVGVECNLACIVQEFDWFRFCRWKLEDWRRALSSFQFVTGKVSIASRLFQSMCMDTVAFYNVTFSRNTFHSQTGSLLALSTNVVFALENCTIEDNSLKNSSFLILNYERVIFSALNFPIAKYASGPNVIIRNVTFRRNSFTTKAELSISFPAIPQSVLIENCRFEDEHAAQSSLVSIVSPTGVSKLGIFGPGYYPSLDGSVMYMLPRYYLSPNAKRIEFLPVYVHIRAITVTNSTAGADGLFFIAYLTFIEIDNITLRSVTSAHCFPLVKLDSCYAATLTRMLAEDIDCELGIGVVQIASSTSTLAISNSIIRKVKAAVVISTVDSESVVVSNVSISNCTAAARVAYFAGKTTNVEMRQVSFLRNKSPSCGLNFDHVNSASISESVFRWNDASNGGAVLIAATNQMSIRIDSTLFADNSASEKGGAIHIEFTAPESRLVLSIADCKFEGNRAAIGAGLSIASGIELLSGSSVTNSVFIGHTADSEGAVSLHYSPGSLQFANCTFADNRGTEEAAILAGIASIRGKEPAAIRLSSVTFRNNSGSYVLRVPSSSLFSSMIADNLLFANNVGVCLYLEKTQLSLSLARFERNKASSGPAITLISSNGIALNGTFAENSADSSGGAVYLTESSNFECNYCDFESNFAVNQGGAAKVERNALLQISNAHFAGNKAGQEGSALYFLLTTANSIATNSEFVGNLAGADGTIVMSFSNFQMRNCSLMENKSQQTTPGVFAMMSNLTISGSEFKNQSGVSGIFVYVTSLSVALISSSSFSNAASSSYGAFYIEESVLDISNCEFRSLSASQGSLAYAFNRAILVIQSCAVSQQRNIEMGAISIRLASVSVSGSQFSNNTNSSLWGQASSVSVISSEFTGMSHVESTGGEGVGLYCAQCVRAIIKNCNFTFLSGTIGGAISLINNEEDATVYVIASSVFVGNTARKGGGVYVNNVWANLTANAFVDNSAYESGGAVVLTCDSPDKNCSYRVEHNTFQRNRASLKGGAIAWEDISPNFSRNVYDSNSASYGNSVSSFATHLSALNSSLSSVASGQKVSQLLVFLLQDHYNQTVYIDNSTKAEVVPAPDSHCLVYGTTEAAADRGVFRFDSFVVSAQPGSIAQIQVRLVGESEGAVMNVSMRLCEIGESLTDGRCLVCEAGKYSFDPTQPCQDCPGEAICKGKYTVVPRPGYWRSSYLSKTFYACPNTQACLGPPSPTGTCAEGYRGNKCQVCDRNFFRVTKLYCNPCPSNQSSIARTIGLAVVMLLFAVVLVVSSMKSAYKAQSRHSVYLKILMNYFQLVMLMGTFNLNWPKLTRQLLDIQDSAGGFAETLFSSACLHNGYDENEEFYSKAILMSLVPLIFVGASSLVWMCIALRRRQLSTLKNELVGSGVILFLLVHPSVIRSMIALFNCEEIDSEFWLAGLDLRCWEGSHWKYALGLALPSIVVWGIGVPALALVVLIVYKKRLPQLDFKIRFGYLYNGYAPEKYYWEFIVIYRKLLIISIALFLSRVSHLLQALLVFAILLLSLFLHQRSGAYSQDILNEAEHRSLLVSTVTLFAGLYYLAGSMGTVLEDVFFVVIITTNAYFLQYWVRKSAKSWVFLLISKPISRANSALHLIDAQHFDANLHERPICDETTKFKDDLLRT